MTVRKRRDIGLLITARAMSTADVLSRNKDKHKQRQARRVIQGAARGEEFESDELFEALADGVGGLGTCTIAAGVLTAGLVWLSNNVLAVGTTALAAVAAGLVVFLGVLASIYMARDLWTWFIGGHPPKRADFWVSAGCGLATTAVVFVSLLDVHGL